MFQVVDRKYVSSSVLVGYDPHTNTDTRATRLSVYDVNNALSTTKKTACVFSVRSLKPALLQLASDSKGQE